MPTGYPKEIIEKADDLLKEGHTMLEVAKILGLPRAITIADWKTKYGIGKPSISNLPDDLRKRNLEIWQKVQDLALKWLEEGKFKSAEGAVQALDLAEKYISILGKVPQPKKEKRERVLEVLEK